MESWTLERIMTMLVLTPTFNTDGAEIISNYVSQGTGYIVSWLIPLWYLEALFSFSLQAYSPRVWWLTWIRTLRTAEKPLTPG